MPKGNPERRVGRRVPARVPVTVKAKDGSTQVAHTRDVSTNGMFLYMNGEVSPGHDLEFVLMLPPEMANGEKKWVCCQALVVRVEPADDGRCGVAASITRLDV